MDFTRIAVIVLVVLAASATLAVEPDRAMMTPMSAATLSVDNATFIDVNRILMFVTNHGNHGRDLAAVFGYDYGTWWPYAGDTSAIRDNIGKAGDYSPQYCAGLWLGGKVDGYIRVAISEYSSEYVPGPMEGGTYMPDSPEFHVYKLYRDSLADNPNLDYINWPVGQGAPIDPLGDPVMLGDQMLWSVYNDAGLHSNAFGSTLPLGIEIQQTTYGYDRLGSLGDIVFIQYKLYNRGSNNIEDFYISMWSDPDLGIYLDDYVGCDTMCGIWFVYNSDNDDGWYGIGVPAAGFKVLAGPVVSSPGDSAYFDGHWVQNYRNLDMSSFNKFINSTDPDYYTEVYDYMQGLTKSGEPYVFNGDTLMFVCSGDPVAGTGDLDTAPEDRRMMANFGPLEFFPGDSQYVLIAYAVGRGANNISSVTVVKQLLNTIEDLPLLDEENHPPEVPGTFAVRQNYPNPFNPKTVIEYSLPEKANVTVDVYNILGQKVIRLVDEEKAAGVYEVTWNGTDENGEVMSTGLYFCRVKAGDKIDNKKMVLLK